jgi:hypothetical protein
MNRRWNELMNNMFGTKDILFDIKQQIVQFDNKASIMIGIVGISFGVTTSLIGTFSSFEWENTLSIIEFVLIILFSIFFLATTSLLVGVIAPKKNKSKSFLYYGGITKISENELMLKLSKSSNKELISQIKINGDICNKKHILLR